MRGIHLNVLIGGDDPIDATTLAQAWRTEGARIWAEPVKPENIRNVAAYISKRCGMPTLEEYEGRLYGTFGAWKSLPELMMQARQAPVVQAAQFEHMLPDTDKTTAQDETIRAMTKGDYADIARKNLPKLYAMLKNPRR